MDYLHHPVLQQLDHNVLDVHRHLFSPGHALTSTIIVRHMNTNTHTHACKHTLADVKLKHNLYLFSHTPEVSTHTILCQDVGACPLEVHHLAIKRAIVRISEHDACSGTWDTVWTTHPGNHSWSFVLFINTWSHQIRDNKNIFLYLKECGQSQCKWINVRGGVQMLSCSVEKLKDYMYNIKLAECCFKIYEI